MSDMWKGATWNEKGELVVNIHKEPPKHTYKEIDCGGDCGGCIDLTSEMPGFADWFKNNGKDLIIKVEY